MATVSATGGSDQEALMSTDLQIRNLGRVPFEEALQIQLQLVEKRALDEIADTLLLCEHDPVFTLGRGTKPQNIPQQAETPVVATERGGDITWHGPGQIVGYWIRKLALADRDLHQHLRLVEKGLIAALGVLGLEAGRNEGLTGVWVDDRKIASIGVGVRQWITFHGFALNLNVDPAIYGRFNPCGLDGGVMTDLHRELAPPPAREDVENAISQAFRRIS